MRYSIIEGHDTPYAEVMTEKEFLADYGELSLSLSLLRFEEKVRHCKADIFERSVHGSLSVPSEERGELSGRFYIFETGNILEPSMGVGNFFGMLPEEMRNSRLYGVELLSLIHI